MLKGETFELQTFTSDAFSFFADRLLNNKVGVLNGCELSNTDHSVTIGEGNFLIKGRFLKIVTGETIDNITSDGYYSLICEIDLSQTNTTTQFNQGVIKVLSNLSAYPILTKQDLTNGGTVYQYEFAQFRVLSGTIQNFVDKRNFVEYGLILTKIEEELEVLKNQSNVVLKDDYCIVTDTITTHSYSSTHKQEGSKIVDLPLGWNRDNCKVVSVSYDNNYYSVGATSWQISTKIGSGTGAVMHVQTQVDAKLNSELGEDFNLDIKIILKKIQ